MKRIADDVWQIPLFARQSVNAYLVGTTLIDTGIRQSAGRLRSALRGRDLTEVVLTHCHLDHQGAAHAVCTSRDVPLACHEIEADAVEAGDPLRFYPDRDALAARLPARWFGGPGHPVARRLTDGDRVEDFNVVHTPGHSPGHISLWRERDGTLIAGDAAVGMNLMTTVPGPGLPLKPATADMELARDTLRRLATLTPARVAFGHGPVADGAAFVRFAQSV